MSIWFDCRVELVTSAMLMDELWMQNRETTGKGFEAQSRAVMTALQMLGVPNSILRRDHHCTRTDRLYGDCIQQPYPFLRVMGVLRGIPRD